MLEVVRLPQAELGWLGFINKLGFGSAMVCVTVPRLDHSNDRWPAKRTLCYLGELNSSAHARWQKTIEVFNEHGESAQMKPFSSEAEVPDVNQERA
jgi:hypothetical protein